MIDSHVIADDGTVFNQNNAENRGPNMTFSLLLSALFSQKRTEDKLFIELTCLL